MSSDFYDVLDELAARGRRLRGQLPGDYKPINGPESALGQQIPTLLVKAHQLIMDWPVDGSEDQQMAGPIS
jgi:hypothetical protein